MAPQSPVKTYADKWIKSTFLEGLPCYLRTSQDGITLSHENKDTICTVHDQFVHGTIAVFRTSLTETSELKKLESNLGVEDCKNRIVVYELWLSAWWIAWDKSHFCRCSRGLQMISCRGWFCTETGSRVEWCRFCSWFSGIECLHVQDARRRDGHNRRRRLQCSRFLRCLIEVLSNWW